MAKKLYPIKKPEVNILTPPNETYNGKEIGAVITSTAGIYVQSGQSIKIFNSKEQPKSRMPKM